MVGSSSLGTSASKHVTMLPVGDDPDAELPVLRVLERLVLYADPTRHLVWDAGAHQKPPISFHLNDPFGQSQLPESVEVRRHLLRQGDGLVGPTTALIRDLYWKAHSDPRYATVVDYSK